MRCLYLKNSAWLKLNVFILISLKCAEWVIKFTIFFFSIILFESFNFLCKMMNAETVNKIFEHSPVSRIKQFVRNEIRKFWLLLKSRFFNSSWHLNSAKNIWFEKPKKKKTSELLDIFYFLWDWRAYHVFN